MTNARRIAAAFTVVELLAVLGIIALLAATLLPALARTKSSVLRIDCSDNLKRIGLGFQSWSASHNGAPPMRVPLSGGGYSEFIGNRTISTAQGASRGVFGVFAAMSNELASAKFLVCPAENEPRIPAVSFAATLFTNDLNTSYFIGVDALPDGSASFLSGDHNLGSDGNVVPLRGFVTAPQTYSPDFKVSLGTNFTANGGVGWLNTMHAKQGNVVMSDGSVQQLDRTHLQQLLQSSSTSGGFGGPIFPNPPGCSGLFINRIQFP